MAIKQTQIVDTTGNPVNSSSEESVLLLRRIAKLLESNGVVDATGRQRCVLDTLDLTSASAGGSLLNMVITGGSANITFGPNGNNNYASDSSWFLVDVARYSYASGIRTSLKWT